MSDLGPTFEEFIVLIGFLFIPITIILFLVGLGLLIAKKYKAGKMLLIISGCCLVVSIGACGSIMI